MARLIRLVALAIFALLVIGAAKDTMQEVSRSVAFDLLNVEQQRDLPDGPLIANPTSCVWDADDELIVFSAGNLVDSYTLTECVIEDWTDHRVAIVVTVKSKPAADLTASIHFVRTGITVTSSELVRRDKRFSEIRICTKTHHYDRSDTTGEAVGEGYGWPTDVEFTVTNNGRRARVSITAAIVGDSSAATTRWCGR